MKLYTMPKDFKAELTGMMKQADALLDANRKEFACKAGCSNCCESFCWNLIEVINIRENMKYRGLLRRLRNRVAAYNDEYYRRKAIIGEAAQDDDVFRVLFKDLRCIFLHSNRCLVYHDRPLACRLYASRDGKSCSGLHELQPDYQERANNILGQAMLLNSRYTELYHPGFNYQPYPFRFLIASR